MFGFWKNPLVAAAFLASAFLASQVSAAPQLAAGSAGQTLQSSFVTTQASYAAVGSATSVPYGWIGFCQRYAGECTHGSAPAVDVALTQRTIREISRVNLWVNRAVRPVSDWDHWHVADQWDYPMDGKGDCEDYALLKRRLLIALGLPRQALLMTVVKDEHNDGHAILTVKTNRGEFILDNLSDEIKPWTQTPYRFVKRQSQTDENVWVNIGSPTEAPEIVSRR